MPIPNGSGSVFDYLAYCGSEASCWLESLRATEGVDSHLRDAIQLLRRHDLAAGRQALAAADEQLCGQDLCSSSIRHHVSRQYWTVVAYASYLEGGLADALYALDRAEVSLKLSLQNHDFLVPLALDSVDFAVQRARIARRENRWIDAKTYVETVRNMFGDREPFCLLDNGISIFLSTIRDFLENLPATEQQKRTLQEDLAARILDGTAIARMEELIFHLPGLVIPYP